MNAQLGSGQQVHLFSTSIETEARASILASRWKSKSKCACDRIDNTSSSASCETCRVSRHHSAMPREPQARKVGNWRASLAKEYPASAALPRSLPVHSARLQSSGQRMEDCQRKAIPRQNQQPCPATPLPFSITARSALALPGRITALKSVVEGRNRSIWS